jgi:hypothetical protein
MTVRRSDHIDDPASTETMEERPTRDLNHYPADVATLDGQTGDTILSPDEEALVDVLVDYWIRFGSRTGGETQEQSE